MLTAGSPGSGLVILPPYAGGAAALLPPNGSLTPGPAILMPP
jgi:hypothetical protein